MAEPSDRKTTLTATHWGRYTVHSEADTVVAIEPVVDDPRPSPIGAGMVRAQNAKNRVTAPMIRRGWLENGPRLGGNTRGRDEFVEVSWSEAFDLAGGEIERIRSEHGNEAIYGGSYGWASAGRFHHAQSQIHRFLRTIGGYTDSVNSYSMAAMEVIQPHVIGGHSMGVMERGPRWEEIREHGELVVSFGGMAVRNGEIVSGGLGRHEQLTDQQRVREGGITFVNISPWRNDLDESLSAEWIPLRPGTDVAMMLAIAWTMIDENLHDQEFLRNQCVGFDVFESFVLGASDGQPKTPEWAAQICSTDPAAIRDIARRMATQRTTVNVTWAVQRQQFGEQPEWLAVVLSAMSGSMGKPGGGPISGLGIGHLGVRRSRWRVAALPQGTNPVTSFIPVARITDMLQNPGGAYNYNGQRLEYPDIRMIYWAGGNPFHHHQDLNRLNRAWQRPETVISHDSWWNPLTRRSDIVFPVSTVLERDDFAIGQHDLTLSSIEAAVNPPRGVRSDYAVFCGIAERMGVLDEFSEGRTDSDWVRHLYDTTVTMLGEQGVEICGFDEFRQRGSLNLPERGGVPSDSFEGLRADPDGKALTTPSGKIEIFSETIASFGYADCPGHPVWQEPDEWLGSPLASTYPLHLLSPQPKTRLHSQYDGGEYSQSRKVRGREPVSMNPADMAARGIATGDLVEIFNDRGRTLAGAVADDTLIEGVIALATGAWFDPDSTDGPTGLERHGNPNVLTKDFPTSQLAQAPASGTALVEVVLYAGTPPRVEAFDEPVIRKK